MTEHPDSEPQPIWRAFFTACRDADRISLDALQQLDHDAQNRLTALLLKPDVDMIDDELLASVRRMVMTAAAETGLTFERAVHGLDSVLRRLQDVNDRIEADRRNGTL